MRLKSIAATSLLSTRSFIRKSTRQIATAAAGLCVATLITTSFSPASAQCRTVWKGIESRIECKRSPLPKYPDGWAKGLPDVRMRKNRGGSEDSCLSVYTEEYYKFRVSNKTNSKISYKINGQGYSLKPGYGRNHKFPKAKGTNSCNIRSYKQPVLTYDASYAPGVQRKSYRVGRHSREYFKRVGNNIQLFH